MATTRIVRPAAPSDLRAIYDLQNGPFRENVFTSPLPDFEEFRELAGRQIAEGRQAYCVLVENDQVTGFIWYEKDDAFSHVTIWGRWLKTLTYAAFLVAFELLGIPRLVFVVRESNRRMVRVCEAFAFRLAGQDTCIYLSAGGGIVVGRVNIYEITAAEFTGKKAAMASQALPLEFHPR